MSRGRLALSTLQSGVIPICRHGIPSPAVSTLVSLEGEEIIYGDWRWAGTLLMSSPLGV